MTILKRAACFPRDPRRFFAFVPFVASRPGIGIGIGIGIGFRLVASIIKRLRIKHGNSFEIGRKTAGIAKRAALSFWINFHKLVPILLTTASARRKNCLYPSINGPTDEIDTLDGRGGVRHRNEVRDVHHPGSLALGMMMSQKIRILVVEDDLDDADLLTRKLQQAGFDFDFTLVDTENDYRAHLKPDLDLILSDFDLPGFSGSRALELLKESKLDVPFIIVSGTIGEERAVEVMRMGAADYLIKDRTGRLESAVRRALQGVVERRERKRLEAQFIEAQKMEIVGQLAGGVAHDFNNVLAVIMGYSELIVQDLGDQHPLQKYAEEVRHAAKRASGLTQQLLIFSRRQTVQATVIDLNEIIVGMEKMLRRLIDENVEMSLVLAKKLGTIKADSGYLWQVLMNLVINARDAMPDGGKIIVETADVTLDDAYVEAHPGPVAGDYVMLSVSDTGVGMSEEVKAHLFEAFFTTKPKGKGTGLGLVTCQNIVRQSGGYIELESAIGRGTRFRIFFPRLTQDRPIAPRTPQPSEQMVRGTETLLVVEDEPALRHLAQGVLQSQGYRVLTATNGQDALRVARENAGHPISLVLSDVIMPQMGGKVLSQWLKLTYPEMKVLFTSGYTDEAIAHHGVMDKDVEFLPKPYTPAALSQKVRALLDA